MRNITVNRFDKGNRALLEGDLDTADHEFRLILEQDPNNAEGLLGMAYTYFSRNDIDRGKEYLERAHQLAPENPIVLYKLGYFHESMDNLEKAREFYEKAYHIEKNNPEINAAIERMEYLSNGNEMNLSDGTYVGDDTYIKQRKFDLNIFASTSKLIKMMRQFYKHIGKEFRPNFLYYFLSVGTGFSVAILVVALILVSNQNNEIAPIIGSILLVLVLVAEVLNLLARFMFKQRLKDVRAHLLEETGYQIADPDRGTDELCRITHKTSLLTMVLSFLIFRGYFSDKEITYEIWNRADLAKPAWWQFKKKKKLSKTHNLRKVVEDVLNRHWLFHLRNSKLLPNWKGDKWSDNRLYIRHYLLGEDADTFDFKAIDNRPLLVKILTIPYMAIGVPLGITIYFVAAFLAITIVFAPLAEKLIDEIAPAVMTLRKPKRAKGVESIAVKDGLVIRVELQSMESLF